MAAASVRRYRQLIERALFDLKLAQDAAVSVSLPATRLARLRRVRCELRAELAALGQARAEADLEPGEQNRAAAELPAK